MKKMRNDEEVQLIIEQVAKNHSERMETARSKNNGKIPRKTFLSIVINTAVEIENAASSYLSTTDYSAKIFEATRSQTILADSLVASSFAVAMSIALILKTDPTIRKKLLPLIQKTNNLHNSFANNIYNLSQIAGAFAPGNLPFSWPVIFVTALIYVASFVLAAGSTYLLNATSKTKEELWEESSIKKLGILAASGYEGANFSAGTIGRMMELINLAVPQLRAFDSSVRLPIIIASSTIYSLTKTVPLAPNLFESQRDAVFMSTAKLEEWNKLETKIGTVLFFVVQLSILALSMAEDQAYLWPLIAMGIQTAAILITSQIEYKHSNQDNLETAPLLAGNSPEKVEVVAERNSKIAKRLSQSIEKILKISKDDLMEDEEDSEEELQETQSPT